MTTSRQMTPEQVAKYREYLRTKECDRCMAKVDGNVCYSQQEWTHFGGQRVQVVAYYCDACARLLGAIGAGEHAALQDRAIGATDAAEPYTKED